MIRLNCFFKANCQNCYTKALEAAKTLTLKSQNHAGCKAYDVFTSATRPDVFMICETWEDEESLEKHSQTPEFKECVEIINQHGTMKIEKLGM